MSRPRPATEPNYDKFKSGGNSKNFNGEQREDNFSPGSTDIYTLWKPSQFLDFVEPPDIHIVGPGFLTRSELTALIGQAGIGKSRLMLWLAICQIIEREWCGIPTIGPPKKWLYLGNENTCIRIKSDLKAMFALLAEEQRALV